jgi:hypothetical protein
MAPAFCLQAERPRPNHSCQGSPTTQLKHSFYSPFFSSATTKSGIAAGGASWIEPSRQLPLVLRKKMVATTCFPDVAI